MSPLQLHHLEALIIDMVRSLQALQPFRADPTISEVISSLEVDLSWLKKIRKREKG